MRIRKYCRYLLLPVIIFSYPAFGQQSKAVVLDSPDTTAGYLAYLLINEVPFPGEYGYVSSADSKAAMMQILWVVHCRIALIPKGYTQTLVANVKTDNIIDVISADGQCEGFDKDSQGKAVFDARVETRIKYLTAIANKGAHPGKFADLLNYAKSIARNYIKSSALSKDYFAKLKLINKERVTGRAYAWMTNQDYYSPGGDFIFIPDAFNGSLGGNRFFTLKDKQ
jgi:hypothetical protein